jgi:hypothetical protein
MRTMMCEPTYRSARVVGDCQVELNWFLQLYIWSVQISVATNCLNTRSSVLEAWIY